MFKVEVRLQDYVFLAILLQEISWVETKTSVLKISWGSFNLYLNNIYVFKPSASITAKVSFDCWSVVIRSSIVWHVCPTVDIITLIMCHYFWSVLFQNSTAGKKMATALFIENHRKIVCNALKWPTIQERLHIMIQYVSIVFSYCDYAKIKNFLMSMLRKGNKWDNWLAWMHH